MGAQFDEALAKSLGWPVEKVQRVRTISRRTLSLDAPFVIGQSPNSSEPLNFSTLGERIPDPIDLIAKTDDKVFLAELNKEIEAVLSSFGEREQVVIRKRFGLPPETRTHTLEEIGQEFGVTRERIRQIEAKTLRNIRRSPYMARLRHFLE